MKLDFSQFHPLDHWPWEQRCRDHYGGWQHHLYLSWEFRRREQLLWPWNRMLCLFGRHRFSVWSREAVEGGIEMGADCNECGLARAVTDEERAQKIKFWGIVRKVGDPEAGAS